ncbi:GlxA family transcriptional regulator [Pedobacter sp. SYSU D00535]|uniref:GlxA family transcriptional regulator n=1 Tax=Pedobacter sp. SYSU D00535 TaxID=2810308 RepID=UPI001A95B678|nr:helix-turn-helix domain-containing protein [Pedobacter sp. SYSU D00535]
MIHLALLLTKKHRLLSLAAALDVFETVNTFYEKSHGRSFFRISLLHGRDCTTSSQYSGYISQCIDEADKQDLIFVPAFGSDPQVAVQENLEFIPWLQQQYALGVEIGSFCTGAFLLAASGLLDDKIATTHIDASLALASCFPSVRVQAHAVVTYDAGLYTSGGATSSFHLMLYVIEKYCGREMAVRVAKLFAIDMDRDKQLYFGSFIPAQEHGDKIVLQAQRQIESNFDKLETIEEIVHNIPSSRRNIVRRFKQVTGITPIEYLQKVRVEAAKKLLELTDKTILEVMLMSGYNDMKAFREMFKKSVGMTPKAYRDKFQLARAPVLQQTLG